MSIDFQELKLSIVREINKLRQDPQSYIPILENTMDKIKDKILIRPNDVSIETIEGVSAYEEAILFLMPQEQVQPLALDENLSLAATDHLNDIGPKGIITHEGTLGKSLSDRIEKYCEWDTACGESIEIGGKIAEDIILSFLVDDGISDRGDRINLFKSEYKFVGLACDNHREHGTITVLNFCGGVRDKDTSYFNYKNFKYEYPSNLDSKKTSEKPKKLKVKNPFQLNDLDAPDGTVSVKIMKNTKLCDGKRVTVTKKYYTLNNGQIQIVEIEEF